jgi:predicted Fe-Mo cluster-binding NifX family protein
MKWIVGLLIVCSSLFSDVTVVASNGNTLTATISSEASRCDYYVFLDSEGKVLETVQNPHKDVPGGASSKLITMLKEKKVLHMIAANFGDKLVGHLQSNHIKYTVHKGDINSAIKSLKNNI